jgi:hypothetical protein
MKRVVVLAAVAAVALVAVTTGSARNNPTLTLTFTAKNLEAGIVDQPPAGVSLGDVRVINRELFDMAGERTGRLTSTCTVVETGDDPGEKELANCTAVFRLAGGEIVTSGVVAFERVSNLQKVPMDVQAVIGGTGVYEGVWGTHTFRQISPTATRIMLHLHRH